MNAKDRHLSSQDAAAIAAAQAAQEEAARKLEEYIDK